MTFISVALAVFAGLSFAIQGPTNTRLSFKIGNLEASLVSFLGGILSLSILVFFIGQGDFTQIVNAPFWAWIGGLYGASMVLVITYSTPLLGAAFTITIIMFGQLLTGILVDAFGWFGANPIAIEPSRILGCLVIMLGLILVYISKRMAEGDTAFNKKTLLIAAIAFLAGSTGGIQAPTNAAMATYIGQVEASLLNFITGFCFTFVALLISKRGRIIKPKEERPRKGDIKIWMLLGGLYGAIGIFINVMITPIIGIALLITGNMFGEIGGGVLMDATGFMTHKIHMNKWRYIGMLCIFAGVLLV